MKQNYVIKCISLLLVIYTAVFPSKTNAQAYYPDNVFHSKCYITTPSTIFGIQELASLSGVDNMTTPIVGDIDNDGKVEILVMNPKTVSIKKGIRIYEVDPAMPPAFSLSLQETIETPYISQFSPGPYAIADVDGDGFAEIFFCTDWTDTGLTTDRCQIIKYKWNGSNFVEDSRVSYETTGQTTKSSYSSAIPYLIDFNGDGIPEIQVYNKIFNAQTLTLLATCPTPLASGGWGIGTHFQGSSSGDKAYMSMMTCGDVDGDGVPEVIGGNCVYKVSITNPSGIAGNSYTLWSTCDKKDASNNTHAEAVDGATSIADIDGDGKLDIVVSVQDSPLGGAVYVWNPRTKKVMHTNVMVGYGNNFLNTGPSICSIGDIDGDKEPEICFNENHTGLSGDGLLHLLKWNGTTLTEPWSIATDDESGATGTSLFDFNNDGKMEIVYRAQQRLMVIDDTGSVLFQTNCTSDTGDEYPVIADVNADGEAEIVVCGSGKIWIYGSGAKWFSGYDPWATARPVWNQYAYNSVNINEDLTVPTEWFNPAKQFNGGPCGVQYPFNGYLMQQSYISEEGCKISPLYDLIVNITDSSYNQATNVLTIKVDIINQGHVSVSNVASTLYLNTCAVANALGTVPPTGTLQPGDTVHNVTFTVTTPLASTDKFIVRTNDDVLSFPSIADECDITNNMDTTMFEFYNVVYDGNSPTAGFPPEDDYLYSKNDPVTVLGNIGDPLLGIFLTKTNSVFLGWSTTQLAPVISAASDTVGSGFKVAGDIFTITQDTTLYAVWAPDLNGNGIPDYDEVNVYYDGNYETLGFPPVDAANPYLANDPVTVLDNANFLPLSKTDAMFIGWSTTQLAPVISVPTDTIGSGFKVVGDIFTITQDTTLYAVWAPDLNGNNIPDYDELHVTYDGNRFVFLGTEPIDGTTYPFNGTVTVLGNTGNLDRVPAPFCEVWIGWSTTPLGSSVVHISDTTGFGFKDPGNQFFITQDTVLYAVWARDSNSNGIPDYLELSTSITPTDTITGGGPSWNPSFSNATKGSILAGCAQLLTVKFLADNANDRDLTISYLGTAVGHIIGENGKPLASSYPIAKGDSILTIPFFTTEVDASLAGTQGAIVSTLSSGQIDTSAWFTFYNRPTFEPKYVIPSVEYIGKLDLGITGGSPYLMRSIDDGYKWKLASTAFTASEIGNIQDSVIIWLREPGSCWQDSIILYPCTSDKVLVHQIVLHQSDDYTFSTGYGIHYVIGHHDFIFTIYPNEGVDLSDIAITTGSIWLDERGGTVITHNDDGSVTVKFRQVVDALDVQISLHGATGIGNIDGSRIWSNDGLIYVATDKAGILSIYTIAGSLLQKKDIVEGTTIIPIAPGIYIVVLGNDIRQKVIVR